jgi:hypothetical protein
MFLLQALFSVLLVSVDVFVVSEVLSEVSLALGFSAVLLDEFRLA